MEWPFPQSLSSLPSFLLCVRVCIMQTDCAQMPLTSCVTFGKSQPLSLNCPTAKWG